LRLFCGEKIVSIFKYLLKPPPPLNLKILAIPLVIADMRRYIAVVHAWQLTLHNNFFRKLDCNGRWGRFWSVFDRWFHRRKIDDRWASQTEMVGREGQTILREISDLHTRYGFGDRGRDTRDDWLRPYVRDFYWREYI